MWRRKIRVVDLCYGVQNVVRATESANADKCGEIHLNLDMPRCVIDLEEVVKGRGGTFK